MLIPEGMWDVRLSNGSKGGLCTDAQWANLRTQAYFEAGGVCSVCEGSGGPKFLNPVANGLECHEEWTWDVKRSIQKLIKLRTLCTRCHRTAHLFGTRYQYGQEAFIFCIRWLKQINNWNPDITAAYVEQERSACEARQGFYTVDVSLAHQLLQTPPTWPTKE